VDGDPRSVAAGDGVIPVHLEEERPWRCPACGFDVRGVPVGGRCSECGEAIDERSFRPRWMRRELAGRLSTWAVVASVANAMPALSVIALLVASAWSGAGGGGGGWVVLFLFSVAMSPVVQWVATSRVARQGFDARRARRIRRCGWIRPGGMLLGLVVFLVIISWGADYLPWIFAVELPWILVIAAAVAVPGVGSDLVLGRTVAEVGREADRESGRQASARGLSKTASLAIGLIQVLGGLLIFVPFTGWVFGLLVWTLGNSAMFARLARTAGRAARQG
jgi:hypothetical protein